MKRLLFGAMCAAAVVPSAHAAVKKSPNVLVVVIDDMGYGDIGVNGNPLIKTPNLDLLRSQSLSMTDFHVAPMSSPTRGALMTGMDAMRSGCTAVNHGRSMPHLDYKMMPEYFKDAGYATGHFGKWHLGDSYPYRPQDRGFDRTLHFPAWGLTSLADAWGNDYFDPVLIDGTEESVYEGYSADIFFSEAMGYMKECKEDGKPFFTYIATNTAHAPEMVDERYSAPYMAMGEYNGVTVPDKFYGMISNFDENMGRLDEFLIDNDLKSNTILVFFSDNGTQNVEASKIYNAGMQGRKQSNFEGGHRVPLFIRYMDGGLMCGVARHEMVQVQDLLPTLIDMTGICEVPKCDGVSLSPLFKTMKNKMKDRMAVVQYKTCAKWDAKSCAVLWDKWRLLPKGRLYNIANDPGQTNNVAAQHPDVVSAMSKYYDEWYAEAKPMYDRIRYITVGSDNSNPTMLYANDWTGDSCDNSGALFNAKSSGYFDIEVEKSGKYQISISRWPEDSNLTLTGYSSDFIIYGKGFYGKPFDRSKAARPIAKAELKVGDYSCKVNTKPNDKCVVYDLDLKAGKTTLEGIFYDKSDNVLCGAMYVKVERK